MEAEINSNPKKQKGSALARGIDGRLSHYLREEPSVPFKEIQVADPLREFIDEKLLPHILPHLGPRKKSQRKELVHQIVASLFLAAESGWVLADSRDTSDEPARRRREVYDALVAAGIVILKTGSELSGKMTRYDLSYEVNRLRKRQRFVFSQIADVTLRPQTKTKKPSEFGPVVLRDKDKKPKPFPKLPKAKHQRIVEMENRILRVDAANLSHAWTFQRSLHGAVKTLEPDVSVRAIFNEDFTQGGRLYTCTQYGYTHLPRTERKTIRIDGEATAELDFGGFHPRRLYHRVEIDIQGDVYIPDQILPELYAADAEALLRLHRLKLGPSMDLARDIIKQLTNAVLNANSRRSATGAANRLVQDNPQFAKLLTHLGSIKPAKLIHRIVKSHNAISRHFFTGVGLKLQAQDVWLLLDIFDAFVDQGKPILGLHDAVIVKTSDADLAKDAMHACYINHFKFQPVIKVSS